MRIIAASAEEREVLSVALQEYQHKRNRQIQHDERRIQFLRDRITVTVQDVELANRMAWEVEPQDALVPLHEEIHRGRADQS